MVRQYSLSRKTFGAACGSAHCASSRDGRCSPLLVGDVLRRASRAIDQTALTPLFDSLADTTAAPDDLLPDTGVGLELERALSPPLMSGVRYGTRSNSVVLVGYDHFVFAESASGGRQYRRANHC
jgi:uncharacterized protein with NRDE domain